MRPVRRSLTGWLAPRWPNGSLNVSSPTARESSWWPRQIPNTGLRAEQRADRVDDVVERRRVARAGHEEEAVGVARQQLLGGRRARVELERRAARGEVADDRVLDAGVERDDPRAAARRPNDPRLARWSPRARGRARPCSARRAIALARLGLRASRRGRSRRASRPPSRMWRTSARVSTPAMPGMPLSRQPVEPALLGAGRVRRG